MRKEPELIGIGQFSKVYRFNSKKVILKSIDPVKECMAIGFFPKSNLFPTIDFFDHMNYDNEFKFIANYDQDVDSKSVISKLNKYYQNMYRELINLGYVRGQIDFQEKVNSLNGVYKYHKEAIMKAFWAIMNYVDDRDIQFEISPKNVSTRNGRLILNDCFFVKSLINTKI